MVNKYNPDIHHRRSIRLKEYDYSQGGGYFVTICTYNREYIFGSVADGKIELNEWGKMVLEWWNNLLEHYPNISLDEFVVMPNHIHGIIIITDAAPMRAGQPRPYKKTAPNSETQKHTLGRIVAFFKYQSTKHINGLRGTPGISIWQRNYYEHIIRSENELNRIREYIIGNPFKWETDEENPKNIKLNSIKNI